MDWDKKIDELAWVMEDKISGKKTSYKKKKLDKSTRDLFLLFSVLLPCATILISGSQVDKIYSVLKSVLDKWSEKHLFWDEVLNDWGITVDIRPIIVIVVLMIAMIWIFGWIEGKISDYISSRILMKDDIYKKLDRDYASEVQLLIGEMKYSDVSQMIQGMKWAKGQLPKAMIEYTSFTCVLFILTDIIVEVYKKFEIWKCGFYAGFIVCIETIILIYVVGLFCGTLLQIKDNIFSNQAIITEYLVEKWRESNKTN